MGVLTDNRQNSLTIKMDKVQAMAQDILSALGSHEAELSVLVVDDTEMAELNEKYLGRHGPTNVISFPLNEGEFSGINPSVLGDVVISAETAEREGMDAGIGFEERFVQLLVHGILHLFGYDHEKTEEEAGKMEAESQRLTGMVKKDMAGILGG